MTNASKPDRNEAAERSTPGRPHDTSRQQKHPDQNVESGSEHLDRNSHPREKNDPVPPGAK
jgi:hypothetical protein